MRTTKNPKTEFQTREQISGVKDMILIKEFNVEDQPKTKRLSASSSARATAVSEEMVQHEFTFKAVRLSKAQKTALTSMIEEAYNLRGYLLRKMFQGENPWTLKPWLISYYSIKEGNVEVYKHIDYLDANIIGYILDDIRRINCLVRESNASERIYLGLNTSEQKSIVLNQYGFSHNFIGHKQMRIMGISQPISLQWTEQLDGFNSIKYGPVKIRQNRDSFYITLSCLVPANELKSYKNRQYNHSTQSQSIKSLEPQINYHEDFVRQNSQNGSLQKRQA